MFFPFFLAGFIGQWHSDFHGGIEKCRRTKLGHCRRIGDYAHLIGACRQRQQLVVGPKDEIERLQVWRNGIMKNLQNALNNVEVVLPILEHVIHTSRFQSRGAFAHLWRTTLEWLQDSGEARACSLLTKHYLESSKRGLAHVEDACWRTAPDVCLGGSASGSQPQEIWHQHRLKKAVGNLNLQFDELHAKLQDFFRSRSQEASQGNACISDAPSYCLDPSLFEGSKALRSSGRTPAREFLKQEAMRVVKIDAFNTIYVMRKSLLWKPDPSADWMMREDKLGGLTDAAAMEFFKLCMATNAEEAKGPVEVLSKLVGKAEQSQVQSTLRVLDRWALVGLGPLFVQFWRLESTFPEARIG